MAFTEYEKKSLLSAKYVGNLVIQRLEEIEIDSFEKLSKYEPKIICNLVAAHLGVSCWGNSPQAKQAIENAINIARQNLKL